MPYTISTKGFSTTLNQYHKINLNGYVTDPNWLRDLARICKISAPAFEVHIGVTSNYAMRHELEGALKFHYAVLSRKLENINPSFNLNESQRTAIINKITEGISACSPGYHNRINSVMLSYFFPKSLDELLQMVRNDIVERTAAASTDDVHANNRFFVVAHALNLGVQPKLASDPYRGNLNNSYIAGKLTAAFKEEYLPFMTLLRLKEVIIGTFDGYKGRNEEGYLLSTYGPALDYLKTLLQEPEINYEYLISDEDEVKIIDLNWNLIFAHLWKKLNDNKYFDYRELFTKFTSAIGLKWAFGWMQPKEEKDIEAALPLIDKAFLTPQLVSPDELETIPLLFSSSKECFAFLTLTSLRAEAKASLLVNTFEHRRTTNPQMDNQHYWDFAANNEGLADAFATQFTHKFRSQMLRFENELIENPRKIFQLLESLSIYKVKGFALKLKYTPNCIGTVFQSTLCTIHRGAISYSHNGLMTALIASKGNENLISQFISLLGFVQAPELQHILSHEAPRENVLGYLLGKGYSRNAWELLEIISTLPNKNKSIILNPRVIKSALLFCPLVAPALMQQVGNLDLNTQNTLYKQTLQSKKHYSPVMRYLIELSILTNKLANNPKKSKEYQTAQQLRDALIRSLTIYSKSKRDPSAFLALEKGWSDEISKAKKEFKHISREWKILLLNLALVVTSIPLLGLPLIANYYYSNKKHVFFQAAEKSVVENLEDKHLLNNYVDFCNTPRRPN